MIAHDKVKAAVFPRLVCLTPFDPGVVRLIVMIRKVLHGK